ncbi:MAG: hypothetical protein IAA89_04570 [Firmicutes bacterium]|uniref:Uncharacterized protein n=1 Tax=Candidatus Gallilactobacillus intestinavium TaxID=2840838 RepID=A0A9D9E5C3_9LACO|nr:hypothetical protein [Candidatus Gallilactobacillus intestinavium]
MTERFLQPKSVHEAMEIIQDLFNQYRNQELTNELLQYHMNLTNRLQSDIYVQALKDDDPKQLAVLNSMIEAMETWTKIKSQNRPFNYKMKNFKLISTKTTKIKRHFHKIRGNHNYHAARH